MRSPERTLALLAASLLMAAPARASEALWSLERALQVCLASTPVRSCPALQGQVAALTRDPAYGRASHLCKEEIGELTQLLALLPKRDADPTDLMASVGDVQQACQPYGF